MFLEIMASYVIDLLMVKWWLFSAKCVFFTCFCALLHRFGLNARGRAADVCEQLSSADGVQSGGFVDSIVRLPGVITGKLESIFPRRGAGAIGLAPCCH